MTVSEEDLILSAIFNQENGGIFSPYKPLAEEEPEESPPRESKLSSSQGDLSSVIYLDDKIIESERSQLRSRELVAISLAEKNDLSGALSILNEILIDEPNYASGYNNRCQVHRAMKKYEEALVDASRTIRLTKCPKILVQAHMQRALIMQFEYKQLKNVTIEDPVVLEKAILQDFLIAAKLGNPIASRFVKMLNPYAALGNTFTKDLLR